MTTSSTRSCPRTPSRPRRSGSSSPRPERRPHRGAGARRGQGAIGMSEASEANKALVLEYMDAFRTFDPARYEPYLADVPTYMAGMNIRTGREAFRANTEAGRVLYPRPEEAE